MYVFGLAIDFLTNPPEYLSKKDLGNPMGKVSFPTSFPEMLAWHPNLRNRAGMTFVCYQRERSSMRRTPLKPLFNKKIEKFDFLASLAFENNDAWRNWPQTMNIA